MTMCTEGVFSTQGTPLAPVEATAAACTMCGLHQGRTRSVFGVGNLRAKIMFIGEGPGQQEDEQGVPFVGRAGQLLTKIIESVGLSREQDVYICNTVKCRPPQNRAPQEDEMAACFPYLKAQIEYIKPEIIVLVGAIALKGVLGVKSPISKIRGQWLETPFGGAKAMAVFHPSYLLRNPSGETGTPKWLTCQDMQAIKNACDALGMSST